MKEPYYKGYIASYQQYLTASPYVREVTARLAPHLAGAKSMLDIGAGTGALSLSMPAHIAVTAVESSRGMCEVIAQRAKEQARDVRIIERTWETADVDDTYDIVLCANAVYRMEPLESSLCKMVRAAKGALLIVMNGRTSVGIYGRMRTSLKDSGIPCPDALRVHRLCEVERALDQLGITCEKEIACWQDVRSFASYNDAADYLMNRYEVADEYREQAAEVLMPYVTKTKDGYCITDDTEMAFLTIKRT